MKTVEPYRPEDFVSSDGTAGRLPEEFVNVYRRNAARYPEIVYPPDLASFLAKGVRAFGPFRRARVSLSSGTVRVRTFGGKTFLLSPAEIRIYLAFLGGAGTESDPVGRLR